MQSRSGSREDNAQRGRIAATIFSWVKSNVWPLAVVVIAVVPVIVGLIVDARNLAEAVGLPGVLAILLTVAGVVILIPLVRRFHRTTLHHRRRLSYAVAVVGVFLVLAPGTFAGVRVMSFWVGGASSSNSSKEIPTVSATFNDGPCGAWVFPSMLTDAQVPNEDERFWEWAEANGGIVAAGLGHNNYITLTVQGSSDSSVVLQRLRVVDLERESPIHGTEVRKCGAGDLDLRHFEINLDKRPPAIESKPGDLEYPGDHLEPATDFPYKVSRSDPEVFQIEVQGRNCVCSFRLAFDWTVAGVDSTRVVDDDGEPFTIASTSPTNNSIFVW